MEVQRPHRRNTAATRFSGVDIGPSSSFMRASSAFMLPVATPPNAIVFGSGMLTIPKMVRAGMMLNILSIFLVSLVALYLAPKFL